MYPKLKWGDLNEGHIKKGIHKREMVETKGGRCKGRGKRRGEPSVKQMRIQNSRALKGNRPFLFSLS